MKQFILVAGMTIFYSAAAFSQTYSTIDTTSVVLKHKPVFLISVHAGYAIGLGSTFKFYPDDIKSVSVESINNQPPSTAINYKSTSKGLGEGFRYGAGFSYILNDFINLGFDFDYFRSTISRTRDSSYHSIKESNEYMYNERYTISYDATLLTLSPAITFKAISRPKFYIYNKLGAVITYRPNSIQKNIAQETMHFGNPANTDSSSYSLTRYEWGIKKPALGFMGSVGTQVKISKNVRAFAEIQFSHIVFAVRNRTLTDYVVNGNNLTNTLSESEKIIEFKNNYLSTQQNADPNQPSVTVVQRIPITYVGLQAGFAYRL